VSTLLVPRSDVGEFRRRYKWMALFVLLAFGVVRISFAVNEQGKVVRLQVESNTANQSLESVTISAIRDAEIAPPPLDPSSPMGHEPLEWTINFTYYPIQ